MAKMAKQKKAYSEALAIAEELVELLEAWCMRIELAGSLRRKRPMVGDIEIVAIPAVIEELDLFGEVANTRRPLDAEVRRLAAEMLRDGPKQKQFLYREMQVDLFLTTAEQWGVILAIRTGSARFSRRLMTAQEKGGFMPKGFKVAGGRLEAHGQVVETFEEKDFFNAIGLGWVAPGERE